MRGTGVQFLLSAYEIMNDVLRNCLFSSHRHCAICWKDRKMIPRLLRLEVIVLGKSFLLSCKVWDVWFQSPCLYTESLRTGSVPDTDVHHRVQESYGTRRYPRQDTNTFLTVIFDMGIGNGVGIIEFHICRGGDRYKQFPLCLRIIIPENQPISELTGIFWWTVEDCFFFWGGACQATSDSVSNLTSLGKLSLWRRKGRGRTMNSCD